VQALTGPGKADPTRVCIVGASYGGYAALAGATLKPGRYRCAASLAGVSDLPMMLGNVERSMGDDSIAADWWRMLIGDRETEEARLRAISPAWQAAQARAPILLLHGTNDTVVPVRQSQRMADALRAAGKPVEFIEFKGEDHWLSDGATRVRLLQELERFLAQHLGGPAGVHAVAAQDPP
jgi:dipeptidyl aminopeptidase/acylaminoacyl peptidase